MKKVTRYAAIGVISASLIGAVVCGLGYAAGLRINTTKSIPVGLYKISQKAPEKGDYVIFCPPERLFSPGTEARLHRQRLLSWGMAR